MAPRFSTQVKFVRFVFRPFHEFGKSASDQILRRGWQADNQGVSRNESKAAKTSLRIRKKMERPIGIEPAPEPWQGSKKFI
jgi:hypothetical protein